MLPESGPLKKADRQKLAAALKTLPSQLAYLQKGILSIADQDQDMLGTGAADVTPLEKCVLRERKKRGQAIDAAGDAAALQEWAEQFKTKAAATWAGPIFFAVGYLNGCDLFDGGEETPQVAKPLKQTPGPLRTTVEVPKGLKVKLFPGGFEAKSRDVHIFYIELDETTYAIKREQYGRKPTKKQLEYHQRMMPGVQGKLEMDFHTGSVRGIKGVTTRSNGLAITCDYLLEINDAKLLVTFLSRDAFGSDIEKYEPLLATIRLK